MSKIESQQAYLKSLGFVTGMKEEPATKDESQKKKAEQVKKLQALIEKRNWILVHNTEDAL